jgi:hypothetical protein
VCQLSSYQSNPTQLDLTAAHRLLNYVSSHPNPHKTIHPSSMALWACTDASYLSRPKLGSVAGCSVGLGDPPHYLLNPPPESRRQSIREKKSLVRASRLILSHPSHPLSSPTTHNAPLHAFCQRIPVVVASVAEAEYAATFGGLAKLPGYQLYWATDRFSMYNAFALAPGPSRQLLAIHTPLGLIEPNYQDGVRRNERWHRRLLPNPRQTPHSTQQCVPSHRRLRR